MLIKFISPYRHSYRPFRLFIQPYADAFNPSVGTEMKTITIHSKAFDTIFYTCLIANSVHNTVYCKI